MIRDFEAHYNEWIEDKSNFNKNALVNTFDYFVDLSTRQKIFFKQ